MSTNMEAALSSNEVVKAASKRLPVPFRRKELFLGSTLTHHTGILLVMSTTSAEVVEKAHRDFGEVEHLDGKHKDAASITTDDVVGVSFCKLTAESESAIGRVASYTKVTHLSLVSSLPKDKCSFEPHVTEVLSVLRLVHLSLKRFCGVKLSVIANLCPHLKFLGIFMCDVDGEEDAAADFPNLEHLHLDCAMKEGSFFKLLRSCPGLRELELEVDELTTAFVVGPPESCGERPRLEHVKRLTLRTNCDVESGLDTRDDLPSDLDLTLACLPSLRRVRSDSYEIRLHVASCFPHIALDWRVCTLCFAEFPKISGDHKYLYKITQDLQLMRPIEVVSYSFEEKSEKDKEGGEVPVDTKEEVKGESEGETLTKVEDTVLAPRSSRTEREFESEAESATATTGSEKITDGEVPVETQEEAERDTEGEMATKVEDAVLVSPPSRTKPEVDSEARSATATTGSEKATDGGEVPVDTKEETEKDSDGATRVTVEDTNLVPHPSGTEQKVETEREAGPASTIMGFEPLKSEEPASAEKPENRQQLHEAGEPHEGSV